MYKLKKLEKLLNDTVEAIDEVCQELNLTSRERGRLIGIYFGNLNEQLHKNDIKNIKDTIFDSKQGCYVKTDNK